MREKQVLQAKLIAVALTHGFTRRELATALSVSYRTIISRVRDACDIADVTVSAASQSEYGLLAHDTNSCSQSPMSSGALE